MTLSLLATSTALLLGGCDSNVNGEDDEGEGGGGTGLSGGGTPATCDLLGTELAPGTAPQERGDMAAAYDPDCNRVFMFFGDAAIPEMCNPAASVFLPDGYVYDATAGIWTNIEVAPGSAIPLQRARSRAIWDELRKRFVVFGGRYRDGTAGPYTFLNDVWAFDPATKIWTELSAMGNPTAPSGRMNMTMDADPANDRFIVHAGGTTDFTSFQVNNETWSFHLETNTWTQIGLTNPPFARLFHMSALDRNAGRLVIYSGGDANAFVGPFLNDTWSLDLATDTWTLVGVTPDPAPRIKGEMVWDETNNRIILFGGHDDTELGNVNDLWTLDLSTNLWSLVTLGDTYNQPANGFCDFPANFTTLDPNSPERRESHLFQNAGDRAIMYGGRTDCGLAKDTWELDYASLSWIMKNDSPLGITCLRTGSPTCVANDNMCL